MFYRVVDRAQFSEVLAGRPDRSRSHSARELPREELRSLGAQQCIVVYGVDPSKRRTAFPELLITSEGREQDWLAWLTAFAQTHRPFTAFCRIMAGKAALQRFGSERAEGPTLGRIEGACIGLILGEILSSEDVVARQREPLPVTACGSTLSFALVRELALYGSSLGRPSMVERWAHLRGLTRQRERALDVRSVVDIVSILEAIEQQRKPADEFVAIAEVLEDLSAGGFDVGRRAFPALLEFGIDLERDTREERVGKFDSAMRAMLENDQPHSAFVLGYLASRINPGTLLHAALLAPALKRYPSVMLWYGVCAGFADPSAIMTALGGLGRRALRDLCVRQHLFDRPTADLSLDELEIFLRERPDDPPDFAVSTPTQLSVELDAGVWSVVNWSRGRPRRPSEEQRDDRVERGWIAQELAPILHRLADVYNRVREPEPPARAGYRRDRNPGPEDATLPIDFKGERPKRRR